MADNDGTTGVKNIKKIQTEPENGEFIISGSLNPGYHEAGGNCVVWISPDSRYTPVAALSLTSEQREKYGVKPGDEIEYELKIRKKQH